MSYSVIIPARYGSTRLPGKPLLSIAGKPMVQHVWEQAGRSGAESVVIATDDERILDAAQGFGADACMTSADHPSGTDRLQEVARQMAYPDNHILVNVQGDEPLIPPAAIDQVAANLAGASSAGIATLCEDLQSVEELRNPNIVKVVRSVSGRALYFSRAPIPWPRDSSTGTADQLPGDSHGTWQRHIGIYAYRTGFLHEYVSWPPAPPEVVEHLEQLRAMYNDVEIHVAPACEEVPAGVDTQEDLDAVRELLSRS